MFVGVAMTTRSSDENVKTTKGSYVQTSAIFKTFELKLMNSCSRFFQNALETMLLITAELLR